ncbi:substrate-binding domain-containing protein [Marinovum sp. 2_MG-2023]|uniref:substrate-binding domain-containing protein n=1 Tax=unclassified Marinovum TaxID=2647166 RepID=UPI0026E40AD6|nr:MULTISPECIES: substrate-binding domain-containing protein [unclassified Marinovum]MDO6729276.1 substrate-binding domain-containing protein [Marinovum sp. 2_MG-2023]MDO6779097.1 substrate-binding domain-containing protein [Marinovum sp. 1_MG-2023]
MKSIVTYTFAAALAAIAPTWAAAQELPLFTLPDDDEREVWRPEQVTKSGTLEALQAAVAGAPVKVSVAIENPIQIALVYPSADTSDFFNRNYIAFTSRLNELGIPFETTEFATRMNEGELQNQFVAQIVNDADLWDFVMYAPSELMAQGDNIQRLVDTDGFTTMIWGNHTPLKDLTKQPVTWFNFDSPSGAKAICEFMIAELGNDKPYALIRGIPGSIDNLRSQTFADCVEEHGNWEKVAEQYADFNREKGYSAMEQIMTAFPEVEVIHNANTAMGIGAVEAQIAAGKTDKFFTTAWGGTSLELDAIRAGTLDATPMRVSDDIGAAAAEAIKAVIEGREAELPLVFLGRMNIAHKGLSAAELDALENEAFRYSGLAPVK